MCHMLCGFKAGQLREHIGGIQSLEPWGLSLATRFRLLDFPLASSRALNSPIVEDVGDIGFGSVPGMGPCQGMSVHVSQRLCCKNSAFAESLSSPLWP